MSKSAFDFSDVYAEIEKEIDDLLALPVISEALRTSIVKSVENNVYPYYGHGEEDNNPRHYHRRRASGGLGDEKNYEVTPSHLSITVENMTTGNGAQPGESWTSGPINDIIETGVGYGWTHSQIYMDQPAPRPFMQQGIDEFTDEYLIPMIESKCFSK